jgi:putative endonuclease
MPKAAREPATVIGRSAGEITGATAIVLASIGAGSVDWSARAPKIYQMLKGNRHAWRMTVSDRRRRLTYDAGLKAEMAVRAVIEAEGWRVLGQRLRTSAGEIDLAAERDGLLVLIEVKARPSLAAAAWALTDRQRRRLEAACDLLLAEHPDWGAEGVRFDLFVVDQAGRIRRIADAFRVGDAVR